MDRQTAGAQFDRTVRRRCRVAGEHIFGAEQLGDTAGCRVGEEVRRGACLQYAPVVEHGEQVGEECGLVHIVRHVQHRDGAFALQGACHPAHGGAARGVEGGEGFVEEEHTRLAGDRARESDELLFAATQGCDRAGEERMRTGARDSVLHGGVVRRAVPDVCGDVEMWKQQ